MKSSRTLVLRRETLVELGPGDMRHVAGASHDCMTTEKITHGVTCQGACTVATNPVAACLSAVDFLQCMSLETACIATLDGC